MGKRTTILALLLSVMMLFVSGVSAFAAPARSARPEDFYGVDDYEIENEDIPLAGFIIQIIDENVDITDPISLRYYQAVLAELEKIAEFFEGEDEEYIINYFDVDIKELFAKLLTSGFDLELLEMNEYNGAFALNYKSEMGDVSALFKFLTEYKEGQTIVAFVGIPKLEDENDDDTDYDMEIYPLKAEVVRNKFNELRVKITFTQEVMEAVKERPFALGILSAKEED